MEFDNVVVEVPCEDRYGEAIFRVKILREFDMNYAMDPYKIRDLWAEFRKHDVLFSDYTAGKLPPFLLVLMDPRGVWFEVERVEGDEVKLVGVIYITAVKPGHEADGHFAFWDRGGRGREAVLLFMMEWLMDRYQLYRINAAVPAYQSGVRRYIQRAGFIQEGVKRQAVLYKGSRGPLVTFGILKPEVEEHISALW